jgi:hypothetical protein
MRLRTLTPAILLLLSAINLYSYLIMPKYPAIADSFACFGWPFHMYAEGGFVGTRKFIWTGLFANVIVALYVASIADITFIAIKNLKKS